MHILLTDILTCPHCGPEFGLIVMADRIEERRVLQGVLGCANCRQSYEVTGGVADLRLPGSPELPAEAGFEADPERVFRAAALLGISTPNATVLVVEPAGVAPAGIAGVLQGAHVVGASSRADAVDTGDGRVVSQTLAGARLPMRARAFHGVALLGAVSETLLEEAARVLMPGAALVVDPAPVWVADHLRERGFTLRLEQEGVVVAGAPGPG